MDPALVVFDAPTPVRPNVYFLGISTYYDDRKGGGIEVTVDTARDIETAVRRAVRRNAHQWFEVEGGATGNFGDNNVDAFFADSVLKALNDAIAAASVQPGPMPQRWRLSGLEFDENGSRLSFRIEPETPPKLKLRSDATASTTQQAPPIAGKYRAGTPAVRRDHRADSAAAAKMMSSSGWDDDEALPPLLPPGKEEEEDVLALAASEAAAEEYLREYTAAVEQARQIRMDASRRFMEKMGVVDLAGQPLVGGENGKV